MIDPARLTAELLAIPSPSRQEGAVCDWLAGRLGAMGWTVVRQKVTPGRANIYAHRGLPVLVFSTHLDTVPPELPFRWENGTIYGRGACDAKGVAAAMIAAAEELIAAGETRIG